MAAISIIASEVEGELNVMLTFARCLSRKRSLLLRPYSEAPGHDCPKEAAQEYRNDKKVQLNEHHLSGSRYSKELKRAARAFMEGNGSKESRPGAAAANQGLYRPDVFRDWGE